MFLHDLLLFTGRRDPQHGGPSRFGRSALQAATGLRFHSTRAAASCGHMETAKKPICTARLPAHPAARAETARMRTQAFALSAAGRGTARGDAAWAVFEPCLPPRTRGRRFWFFCYYRAARGGGPKGCGNRDPEKYLCAARGGKAAKLKAQGGPFPHLCAARGAKATLTGVTRGFEYHLCAARGGKACSPFVRSSLHPIYAPRAGARHIQTESCASPAPLCAVRGARLNGVAFAKDIEHLCAARGGKAP